MSLPYYTHPFIASALVPLRTIELLATSYRLTTDYWLLADEATLASTTDTASVPALRAHTTAYRARQWRR